MLSLWYEICNGENKHMINENKDIYSQFPCILNEKIKKSGFTFPEGTKFEYEPIQCYRCIERENNDNTVVNKRDFLSNIEEFFQNGKPIRKKRGQTTNPEDDINYYGVSLFKNKECLVNVMRLPRPTKKICHGYVIMTAGPQLTEGQHVNWWIYKDANLGGFSIVEEE